MFIRVENTSCATLFSLPSKHSIFNLEVFNATYSHNTNDIVFISMFVIWNKISLSLVQIILIRIINKYHITFKHRYNEIYLDSFCDVTKMHILSTTIQKWIFKITEHFNSSMWNVRFSCWVTRLYFGLSQ